MQPKEPGAKKNTAILSIVSFVFLVTCCSAQAEKSVTTHPTHHQQTNQKALGSCGFAKERIEDVNAGSKYSDDWSKPQFQDSRRHFDDCRFDESMQFVKDRISAGREKARNSFQHEPSRSECLFAFGEALHSMQDFIAHSNFIEWHLDKNMKIPDVFMKTLEDFVQSKKFKSGFLTEKEVALIKQESPEVAKTKGKDFTHWFQDNKLHDGQELDKDKFHSQPQFNQRFNAEGKPSFKTAVTYVLDDKNLLRYELNKERASDAQGCVKVQCKDKHYNGKTLHQIAAESARQLTANSWKNIENDIWKEEDTACLQIAAIKGQQLPTLQLRLNSTKLNKKNEKLDGTCSVVIKNFPKNCPAPVKVKVKFTLLPGKVELQHELKFQKSASQTVALKTLSFPEHSLKDKTQITAEAVWVGAENFQPSKDTQAIQQ